MKEQLEKQLLNKLDKEFNEYINEITKLSKEEIIKNAYRISNYENFRYIVDFKEYSILELKALLQEKKLLNYFYNYFLKYDEITPESAVYDVTQFATEDYAEFIKDKVNESNDNKLLNYITKTLNDLDNNNLCDKFKEKFNVEKFNLETVYVIVKHELGVKDLYNYFRDINNNKELAKKEITNIKGIEEIIIPKLDKIIRHNKNKERETR